MNTNLIGIDLKQFSALPIDVAVQKKKNDNMRPTGAQTAQLQP